MSSKVVGTITRLCIAGIILGILGMIQPWVFELFRYGFYVLLLSTLVYIVISHVPERSSEAANPDVLQELPLSVTTTENRS